MNNETANQEKEINQNMKMEILKSFHSQFAENQNHQQKIFLQFFSAILIVAIPFGIVFINTSKNADLWELKRNDIGDIVSYAISHLLGAWATVQIALITLSSFALQIAYSFRRDQKVVENIRKIYFKDDYEKYFGKINFSASNKKLARGKSYVPLFCALFWQFAIMMQWITSFAMCIQVYRVSNHSSGDFIPLGVVIALCILSIAISYFWKYYYFLKYITDVEQQPQNNSFINRKFHWFLGE